MKNNGVSKTSELGWCLADSTFQILSWDATAGLLTIRVMKDAVPEVGSLIFSGVTHVNLPLHLEIERIDTVSFEGDAASAAIRERVVSSLISEERKFVVRDSHDEEYFVIAERIDYRIDTDTRS